MSEKNNKHQNSWTLQILSECYHGYPDWAVYAIRDRANHCIAVIGEADRATAPFNKRTAELFLKALRDNEWKDQQRFSDSCEREALRGACRDLLKAYAPNADFSKPSELHSAVRKAGEALGIIQRQTEPYYSTPNRTL